MAEGPFRRREMASEGRERGDTVTKGGGDNKERPCHREGRRNVSRYIRTPEISGVREEASGA